MSLDPEPILPPEQPVRHSHTFSTPAILSEQPQVAKAHSPIASKNGLQPPTNRKLLLQAPPSPPLLNQRLGKRRYSVGVGFKGVAKLRRRANSECQAEPMLPSHFLLGGNIFDPLNLNSLLDEDVNRATNLETPKCSPLPSRSRDPVEILVPRDITDPLNLKGEAEDGKGAGVLVTSLKSRRKHRYRHHGRGGEEKEGTPARLFSSTAGLSGGSISASPLSCELNTAITCRDDVAPPPILPRRHTHPLPGSTQNSGNIRRRRRTTSTKSSDVVTYTGTMATSSTSTKFQTPLVGGAKTGRCGEPQLWAARTLRKKDKQRYQYGNHSRFYGYHGFYGDRNRGRVGAEEDLRLCLLEADWFKDKSVLDIGCGTGHVTLAVGLRFNPAHILGVELDERLVHAARQNIRHFLSHDQVVEERERKREDQGVTQVVPFRPFPLSFRVSRGPLSAPPLFWSFSSTTSRFPNNVTFIQGDYVSEGEVWPGQGRYDVIICLGVTKWVHLQSGDGGVTRLFKRAYQSLSPSGLFILEPQPWSSYCRSKRASDTTFHHFRTLKVRPEQFTSFLTDRVGFSSYRLLTHTGNKKPIYLFHKGPAHRK
ncbi:7SK snRNA methylphosphate capping enzyme [Nematolebias whitei]|uniref:7SK snRNA methylphosphate capping enzyme n=1 Tax=Nematolebias whitei TaxID=451745 RepID=UPI00189780E0|nr:7SK snRNA methylphosphate capping enzyme [Nematolebias whitei]